MKKVISIILALAMTLSISPLALAEGTEVLKRADLLKTAAEMFSAPEEAAEDSAGVAELMEATSGTCGKNLTWEISGDGTLTISGTGDMNNWNPNSYPYTYAPWYQSRWSITSAVIEKGVTSIGSSAFYGCNNLTSVTIPSSVTNVEWYAFYNCGSLTSVTLPSGVTNVGYGAFEGCGSLTSVTLPKSMKDLGWYAFKGCGSLTSVTIPNGITSVGTEMFYECGSLTSVTIPDSITSIGDSAFYNCSSLKSVTIPESVTSIGDSAFYNCSNLTNVTIPKKVTSIGSEVFYNCSKITSMEIPDGVTSIGDNAFFGCGLTSVTIPESVTRIGNGAFYNCGGLTSVTIPNKVTAIGDYAFENCSSLTSVTISSGVTSIGNGAFYNCTSLISVTIPDSVMSIGQYAFYNCAFKTAGSIGGGYDFEFGWTEKIPSNAFYNCTSLTSVDIPDGVTSIGNNAFYSCGKLSNVSIPSSVKTIDYYAFRYCTALTKVKIPEGIETMNYSAFEDCIGLVSVSLPESLSYLGSYNFKNCSKLASVNIPSGITEIGKEVFRNCTSLTSVDIPDGVTSIGENAFYGDTALERIKLPKTIETLGRNAFNGCVKITEIEIPKGLSTATYGAGTTGSISEGVFAGSGIKSVSFEEGITTIPGDLFAGCTELESIIVPDTVTQILTGAFQFCTSLKNVTLPESVTFIDNYVFRRCESLTSVDLPDGIESLGTYAFAECSNLKELEIPSGVTSIGHYTFYNCTSLTSVTIPGSVTSVGDRAFSDCSKLTSVTLPDGVTSLGSSVFFGCSSLTSVTIPNSVTSMGSSVFYGCSGLTSVTIPESVTSIGYQAFSGCSSELVLWVVAGSYAEEYAIDNGIKYEEYIIADGSIVRLTVLDEEGGELTSGYTVNWYEKGSNAVLASGETLHGAEKDKEYECEIILDEKLAFSYYTPERVLTAAGETPSVKLARLPLVTVTGSAADKNGKIPDNMTVKATQFAGSYKRNIDTQIDADGSFSFKTVNLPTAVYISANKYYTTSKAAISASNDSESIALGKIILKKLPENKITVTVYEMSAAAQGETAESSKLSSFDDIRFSLYDATGGFEITDFTVQYPHIIIGDSRIGAKHKIRISASSPSHKTEETTVELDDACSGSGNISLTANGKFRTSDITAVNGMYVLVFDESGNLVKRYIPEGTSFYSDAMPDGKYSVVFIEKNSLLRSVPSMEKLDEYGLKNGEDYMSENVNITAGVVSEISGLSVPALDTEKLSYTVSENTSVTANKSSIVTGNFVTVRAEYKIDGKYDANEEEIVIELPEGTELIDGSVTADGKTAAYSVNNNAVTVKTGKPSSIIRFYASATEAGEYDVDVSLNFSLDGEAVIQPLGTARFTASALTLNVPLETNSENITVSGKTIAKSSVTVYDGITAVGTTTANSTGSWKLSFDLVNPYKYSYHAIYAVVESSYFSDMTSERYLVLYNPDSIDVSKVTMINTAHPAGDLTPTEYKTVFDFKNPSDETDSYSYWPNYPMFTFKTEFDKDSDDNNEVALIVYTEDGGVTKLPAKKDTESDAWIATGEFKTGTRPVNVGVEYSNIEAKDISYTLEEFRAAITGQMEIVSSLQQSEDTQGAELIDPDKGLYTKNGEEFVYKDQMTVLGDIPNSDNWMEVPLGDDGSIYVGIDTNGEKGTLTGHIAATPDMAIQLPEIFPNEMFPTPPDQMGSNDMLDRAIEMSEDIGDIAGDIKDAMSSETEGGSAEAAANAAWSLYDMIDKHLNDAIDNAQNRVYSCIYMRLDRASRLDNGLLEGVKAKDKLEKTRELREKFSKLEDGLNTCGDLVGKNAVKVETQIVKQAVRLGKVVGTASNYADVRNAIMLVEGKKYKDCPESCSCMSSADSYGQPGATPNASPFACCIDGCNKRNGNYNGKDKKIKEDPSGYVCEAVPSNRIEGVTATAYYLGDELDEFGEPTGNKTEYLWDAEEYDQINPLVTDAGGSYAWDVPMGKWIIRFSKDGYYDTDSSSVPGAVDDGYLPVPPPQTEVHVAMVSKSAPEVKSVNAYNDGIRIEFSQYMDIGSVNTDNVTVVSNGKSVSGRIEAANAETSFDDENVQYASVFMFVPENEISGTASVSVSGAVNYAGTAMEEAYEGLSSVVIEPKLIEAPEKVSVAYNSGALAEISILPKEAAKGLKIVAMSSSPSIVSVVNDVIEADENGKANIMFSGNLPGSGVVTLNVLGTDITTTITVDVGGVVVPEGKKCAKVTASIDSGSTVAKGTKLELSTATEGAQIYYTLDGTDPCTVDSPSRLKYTEPIVLNEDAFIIAYAVKDGYEDSATAGFTYIVEESGASTLRVHVNGITDTSHKIIAALYSEDGRMLRCVTATPSGTGEDIIEFKSFVNETCYLKIMEWDSVSGMKPARQVTVKKLVVQE